MKIYSALQQNYDGLSSKKRVFNTHSLDKGDVQERYKSTGAHIKKENISTDINRPTESISFSGSAVLNSDDKKAEEKKNLKKTLALIGLVTAALAGGTAFLVSHLKKGGDGNLAKGIALNQNFYNAAGFSEKNEMLVKNILALGLAGMLKPICVLAMPGADEKDKQFTATKNALSAFIGFALSCAISNPINSGVEKFMKNPANYLPKDNWLVQEFEKHLAKSFSIDITKKPKFTLLDRLKGKEPPEYSDTYEAFKIVYKNGLGLIVAPLKAFLTIKSMPFILKVLFREDKKKKDNTEQPMFMQVLNQPNMIAKGANDENIKKTFAAFSVGGAR